MEKDNCNKKSLSEVLDVRQFRHTNSPVFSTAIFAVIMLLVVAGTILSNMSLKSTFFWSSPTSEVIQTNRMERKSLAPPKNTTSRDRIAWLHSHLTEFEVRFFMTWFSPAEYFGKREMLAVESVFKAHPQGCLMIVSGSLDSLQGDSILKPLNDRGYKVFAATPDMSLLLENTPAKSWFQEMKSCKRDPGRIPLHQNLSNLARLAFLYKYGGVYLDTDFIVTRSFKGLKNSIGAQTVVEGDSKNWTRLNNAVLIFEKDHPLVYSFIEEFASTFDGNKWGHNGPYLVTRVAQRARETIGDNFTVLPPVAFYPFNWLDIPRLFQTPRGSNDSTLLKTDLVKLNRESYGLHLWNKITRKLKIGKGSVIDIIISDHCVVCRGIQR
ncbi:alpha 1,4-glycosyltransferase family protein [Arabidopsis thaliana]|uniref:Alpha 1,4-glycosyltransferase family protein n=1 Tax=Arabidopsis thaliana TaxID=3702 RepID=F4IS01_ARATH|eukprot:NP_001154561.1 alpha 1,4-glycosyltransferase family protein [Arabidopsis thaliana]